MVAGGTVSEQEHPWPCCKMPSGWLCLSAPPPSKRCQTGRYWKLLALRSCLSLAWAEGCEFWGGTRVPGLLPVGYLEN